MITIHLDARESQCVACGAPLVGPRHGIPLYEGEVVPPDSAGEWGGFDACEDCFGLYEAGRYGELQARCDRARQR